MDAERLKKPLSLSALEAMLPEVVLGRRARWRLRGAYSASEAHRRAECRGHGRAGGHTRLDGARLAGPGQRKGQNGPMEWAAEQQIANDLLPVRFA